MILGHRLPAKGYGFCAGQILLINAQKKRFPYLMLPSAVASNRIKLSDDKNRDKDIVIKKSAGRWKMLYICGTSAYRWCRTGMGLMWISPCRAQRWSNHVRASHVTSAQRTERLCTNITACWNLFCEPRQSFIICFIYLWVMLLTEIDSLTNKFLTGWMKREVGTGSLPRSKRETKLW